MTICMKVAWLLLACSVLSALDVPRDQQLTRAELPHGLELWLKRQSSLSVACRFVGHNPRQGKPAIFELDCAADDLEQELPGFLDDCEEEIAREGGAALGLVAIGLVDFQGLYDFLAHRYEQQNSATAPLIEAIQLSSSSSSKSVDLCLSYPSAVAPVQTKDDIKKLWTFYLIQAMAEGRLKEAATAVSAVWTVEPDVKHLLPSIATVGRGQISEAASLTLLAHFLQAVQVLKKDGFTEGELANYKSRLKKHLERFYNPSFDQEMQADYYASHLAALLPCPDYELFMTLSLQAVSEITMADIAEMLKTSFLDSSRSIIATIPHNSSLTKETAQQILNAYPSDSLVFDYQDAQTIAPAHGDDPFSKLPITDPEIAMIKDIIHTVGGTWAPLLFGRREELRGKKAQLNHIHPFRSLAVFVSDAKTKYYLNEIMSDSLKRGEFLDDFCGRMKKEAEKNNLLTYLPGFCQAVRANPDQVLLFVANKDYIGLIHYLIQLNNT